jgi:murein DD-endopeptidase MepM/ murein hydrolase activator NlpD
VTGGVTPGNPTARRVVRHRRKLRRLLARPRLETFDIGSATLFQSAGPAKVTFRVDGRAKRVSVRLYVLPAEGGKPVETLELGELATGRDHTVSLDPNSLTPGRYRLRISARDRRGRPLRRLKVARAVEEFALYGHRFPLVGDFSYGGKDSLFGAPRHGHTHQGQDLSAAEGTPVVAPHGGVVEAVEYQARGAGYYVVVDGFDNRDYVFMHLRKGSILVSKGQRVATGEQLAEVGNTGSSSGPHLHFEIWEGGGGWYDGGHPVDPLPYLKSWDRYS